MTRTRVLQEIRRMRFKAAYCGWQARRLTQEEAVEFGTSPTDRREPTNSTGPTTNDSRIQPDSSICCQH